MKRFLSVSLLMLCLSFPAFGGHIVIGGAYCDCTPTGDVCRCCGTSGLSRTTIEEKEPVAENADSNSTDSLPEFALLLSGILIWLRLKA